MCVVKTPKIAQPTTPASEKPLPILRNLLLDGIDPSTQSLRIGRNNLRIDRSPTAPTALRIAGGTGV